MRIVLCTGNPGKVAELGSLLPDHIDLAGLREMDMPLDLPETGETLEANAMQKARYVFERTGLPCIADDSGLEIEALGGRPGVHSARFAGPHKSTVDNNAKVLQELAGSVNRNARMRTIIAFKDLDLEWYFEGTLNGRMTEGESGTNGFGYDPIFIPDGYDRTLAEMTLRQKNSISHRSIAIGKFLVAVKDRYGDLNIMDREHGSGSRA